MLKNVEVGFTSDDYDTSVLEKGNNEVVEYEQIKITLSYNCAFYFFHKI